MPLLWQIHAQLHYLLSPSLLHHSTHAHSLHNYTRHFLHIFHAFPHPYFDISTLIISFFFFFFSFFYFFYINSFYYSQFFFAFFFKYLYITNQSLFSDPNPPRSAPCTPPTLGFSHPRPRAYPSSSPTPHGVPSTFHYPTRTGSPPHTSRTLASSPFSSPLHLVADTPPSFPNSTPSSSSPSARPRTTHPPTALPSRSRLPFLDC